MVVIVFAVDWIFIRRLLLEMRDVYAWDVCECVRARLFVDFELIYSRFRLNLSKYFHYNNAGFWLLLLLLLLPLMLLVLPIWCHDCGIVVKWFQFELQNITNNSLNWMEIGVNFKLCTVNPNVTRVNFSRQRWCEDDSDKIREKKQAMARWLTIENIMYISMILRWKS